MPYIQYIFYDYADESGHSITSPRIEAEMVVFFAFLQTAKRYFNFTSNPVFLITFIIFSFEKNQCRLLNLEE
ncbi:hypothetical protein EKM05_06025 [Flavobacterium sp. GSP27]|uniref:Uncharacterized protein n=1 Tax=Flavobacterium bomense TaxID=2497483 RepID=A0A432CP58_9FLAO|nr:MULTISPECIES: hypothetical protein [Flavobacterium]RTY94801.1 hypothetical protein EKL32_10070 [Flavobacterium sp. GSN2]RTY73490.1 hypothetical protein EKL96_11765 [Flavobacterium sp. LS1R10]RTY79220.1 hypothetical protein EKL97_12855 [Flavobacterium sp. LS1P28]RTY81604.1 hypothetical protein EKL99_12520 [Flavobacterium sp. ZB4P23]RTY87643.1 hypothetical protein EKM00_04955 [Flavobacterium sp. RSP15]